MRSYSLNEITDSRILYDKRPPRFIIVIIFIVLALIVGFLVWSNKSIKTYVVRAQGVVTTENKANVMAGISGEIKDVNIEEGKSVKEGDVLLTINPVESNLQLIEVNNQLDYDIKRIELLERAEKDATNEVNSFDKNKPEEVEFYNRLKNSYAKKKEYAVDEASLKKQGYTDDQINQYKDQQSIKMNELHYETILGFSTEKSQLEADKSKLQAQKETYEKSLDRYKVVAPKSGNLHLATPITKGMVLQAGNLLGSISSNNDGFIVEALLSSNDRALIHEGDEVSLAVAGLNQAEFGTIQGNVVSIDNDATVDSQKGNIYFKVRVKPKKTHLSDKKGEIVNLTTGMATEIRVKYEKITYMKYFLEQIGIKFK